MFEVGKSYRITTGVGDAEGYSVYKVLEWESPLLKVKASDGEHIFNTSSPSFVSAVDVSEKIGTIEVDI